MNATITAMTTPVLTGQGRAQPDLQAVQPDRTTEPDPNRVTPRTDDIGDPTAPPLDHI